MLLQDNNRGMSLQFTINLQFLQSIDPPANYPPTQDQILIQVENKFLNECQSFIANQKVLYNCSKSIENKLKSIVKNSQSIKEKLQDQKDKLQFIAHELLKIKDQERKLKDRQKILKMLCDLIRMQEIRGELLIDEKRKDEDWQLKGLNVNEQKYLSKLQHLYNIIEQSKNIIFISNQFALIKDIIQELESILTLAIKLVIKKLLTPNVIHLIMTQYHHVFLKQQAPYYQHVYAAITNNRAQYIKISLNPTINNLNYATNIPELYQSILQSWVDLMKQELKLFEKCKRYDMVQAINESVFSQVFSKMQKNIFRIKDLIAVIKIRKHYHQFLIGLRELVQLFGQGESGNLAMVCGVLNKCQIIIGSKLTEQSQLLESSKYNIYSMTSYIPIRQHLQTIKLAYQSSIQNQQLDWQVGFYNLCTSRDPKNYPNNKSLIIFNLNIWYLYIKILHQGKHKSEGQQTIKWCLTMFTAINIQEINRKYYESFDKVLQIGGNIAAFKSQLYSELNLLGHDELRKEVGKQIKEKYIQAYDKLLAKIQKKAMTNEQVKDFCQSKKINLNKFGKFSHSICIYSKEMLYDLLEYN